MKSSLRNMVMVLLLISLIASSAVGIVYQLTEEPIEQAKANKVNQAIAEVLPPFTDLSEGKEVDCEGEIVKVYTAKSGSEISGYAVETFSKNGFGGMIKLMVGYMSDGTINKIAVVSHNETPGLGDKIEKSKSDFALQFEGKHPDTFRLAVKKDGGDVDAITASTISSRAFIDAVKRANQILTENK